MTEYQGTTFCPNSLHWFGGGLWSSGSVWCLLLGGGYGKGAAKPLPSRGCPSPLGCTGASVNLVQVWVCEKHEPPQGTLCRVNYFILLIIPGTSINALRGSHSLPPSALPWEEPWS